MASIVAWCCGWKVRDDLEVRGDHLAARAWLELWEDNALDPVVLELATAKKRRAGEMIDALRDRIQGAIRRDVAREARDRVARSQIARRYELKRETLNSWLRSLGR